MMKKVIRIFFLLAAGLLAVSCTDHLDIKFKDFFVCIKSEDGTAESSVSASAKDLVITYYVSLVSEEREEDLTVNLDVVPGDGLKEGVDYEIVTSKSVTFTKGLYKRPFRIKYISHGLDSSKDNTLTIKIASTSDPDIIIGYPGPSSKFSTHVVTKK
ncbi:MAG: hypothetical protein MR294_04000 [Bacteroidales bacterium]|nr:hypothetical protein [Bacteroidales bacterium]